MKALIVTADDFGLAPEVNEGVERAHTRGILTAASLMVAGAAAADAVVRARRLPTLRVGLHLVLVDGPPLLPPERIPHLVDGDGQLRSDLAMTGIGIALRRGARAELAAEIEAQFVAFEATGLPLDHVNAHHHFHLHPTVAALIVDIGRRVGMRGIRVPIESADLLARIDRSHRGRSALAMAPWAALLRRRVRRRGLSVPDRVFGLAWSGAMTEQRILGVLANLADGVTEIYCHPASADRFAGAARGYRYADEVAALTAPAVRDALLASGARSGGFSDVAPR
ncbi:MAG TPA: hopanoid biosynthesis-associated protein HpnK [Casimicrobiaceae bacterium]|nr:hopanoid biosynthesis-associated protein HpnK [Casimicrobiaceae bacterium]